MADEIWDSVVFGFEWRNRNFVQYFFYLILLGFISLGVSAFSQAMWDANTQSFWSLFALTILFYLALNLLMGIVQLHVISMALKARKLPTRGFQTVYYFKFFVLNFLAGIAALFSVYNPRGLVVLGAVVFLGALAFATGSALGVALLVAYLFVVIYNALRLSQAEFFFASRNKNVLGSFKDSLDATNGNCLWLVFVSLVVYVAVALPLAAAIAIITFASDFLLKSLLGDYAGASAVALLWPAVTFSIAFAGVAIYSLLLKRKRSKGKPLF